jgi:hypothetical protein
VGLLNSGTQLKVFSTMGRGFVVETPHRFHSAGNGGKIRHLIGTGGRITARHRVAFPLGNSTILSKHAIEVTLEDRLGEFGIRLFVQLR